MQIGVSSYSYGKLLNAGRMNLLDIIPKTKEIGFDVIEFSTLNLPEGQTPLSFAPRVREACDKVGLPIANYTIGADFLRGSGGDWKMEVERLKTEVQVAKTFGCSGMRHDATVGFPVGHKGAQGFDDALPVLIKACRAVTEYAADHGIRTMVENHGLFCQDSTRIEKLVNGVNHQNFGALIDMGNFMFADEDPGHAFGRLMSYAFHVHAKDFYRKPGTELFPGENWSLSRGGNYLRACIIGHGDVPVCQCLRIMKRAKYDGVLSVEFEGYEDVLSAIAQGHANLRRFVREVMG